VDTDVKLEETDMELESVELANREMEERLSQLRSEVESARSLHSIRSEDLICLRKVRRLAEEELKLKNCIEHLENKECMYRRQMKKILSCKKHQCDNGQMRYARKCDRDGKKPSYPPNDLVAEIMERYPLKDKGRVSRKENRSLITDCGTAVLVCGSVFLGSMRISRNLERLFVRNGV